MQHNADVRLIRHKLVSIVLIVATIIGTTPAPVWGLPAGMRLVHGQAAIAKNGNVLTIQASNKAILNFQSFSINANELVKFLQPGSRAVVLNRVIGGYPSIILGALQANGNVVLLNPHGILFGPSATVNVHGLIASSLDMPDRDFLAGRFRFSGDSRGFIYNLGNITAGPGGHIFLIAPDVRNYGTLEAPAGQVGLLAGTSVLLTDDPNGWIAVQLDIPAGQAVNTGRILADAGRVGLYGKAVRHSGVIEADAARVDEQGNIVLIGAGETTTEGASRTVSHGGKIVVQAIKGTTLVSGLIDASAGTPGAEGGVIHILGKRVGVMDGAVVDVSGDAGGGIAWIGGGPTGTLEVPLAARTYVSPKVLLLADALSRGDGGQIIVQSAEATRFFGSASARGGPTSGNGGLVEISGHYLEYAGAVNTLAPHGSAGNLLFDPDNIEVVTGGTAGLADVDQFGDPGATVQIDPATINAAASNVTLQAEVDITFKNAINMSNAGVGITAEAGDDVIVQTGASITTQGGDITLRGGAPGASNPQDNGDVNVSASLNASGGGNIRLIGNDDVRIYAGTITGGGNGTTIEITAMGSGAENGDIELEGTEIRQTGTGTILLTAEDDIGGNTADTNDHIAMPIYSESGSITLRAEDDIRFKATGDITSTSGDITLQADSDGSNNGSGRIVMVDGTVINAGSGKISLSTDGNIDIGRLVTTSAAGDAITVTTSRGAILDAGDTGGVDISAVTGTAILAATDSANGAIGEAADALETSVAVLAASAGGPIGLNISNTGNLAATLTANNGTARLNVASTLAMGAAWSAKSFDIDVDGVFTIDKDITASGGDIDIAANDDVNITAGTITGGGNGTTIRIIVTGAGADITLQGTKMEQSGTGTIFLDADDDIGGSATGTDHINMPIISASGAITLQADDDIRFLAGGDITSTSGDITIHADQDSSGNGDVTMVDGAVINAGTGAITLYAGDSITVGQVVSTGTVSITSSGGAIIDADNGTIKDVTGGSVTLTAASGIGATGANASIEIDATTLNATNTSSNGIFLNLVGTGGVSVTAQAQTAGNIEILGSTESVTLADIDTFGSDITVTLTGQNLVASDVKVADAAPGNITLSTTGSGNITLGNVSTAGDEIHVISAGYIIDTSGTVTGAAVKLDSQTGVGYDGTTINQIETQADTLAARAQSSGGVHISETDGVALGTVGGLSGVSTNGGDVRIRITSSGATLSIPDNLGADTIRTSGGDVLLEVDNLSISSGNAAYAINSSGGAGAESVKIYPRTARNISLGAEQAGELSLTDSELNEIKTSGDGVINIGNFDDNAGTITLRGNVTLTSAGHLFLAVDDAVDSASSSYVLSVTNLAIDTDDGIGATNAFKIDADYLAAENDTPGNIQIRDIDDLTISTLSGRTGIENDDGNITVEAGGTLTLSQDVHAYNNSNITLTTTSGAIAINANIFSSKNNLQSTENGDGSGTITLNAATAITRSGNVTIKAIDGAVGLSAASDIGTSSTPVQTQVKTIAAKSTSGSIYLQEADALTIGTVGTLNGIDTSGGQGKVVIQSLGASVATDSIAISQNINTKDPGSSAGGEVILTAEDFTIFGGRIITGSANVTIQPVNDGDSIGIGLDIFGMVLTDDELKAIDSSGTLTIGRSTGTGVVTIDDTNDDKVDFSSQAYNLLIQGGNISFAGELVAPNGSTVKIASTGSITDNHGASRDITIGGAGKLLLTSASSGAIGASGNALDTSVAYLEAQAGSGGIFIRNTGDLTIGGVDASTTGISTSGTGKIDITTASSLTITEAVSTTGTGTINITASTDIQVNNSITSQGGAITLSADDNITFNAAGDISSNNGNIMLYADSFQVDGAGGISMADGTVLDAGSGKILLDAAEDVSIGQLITTSAASDAVAITSWDANVSDAGDAAGPGSETEDIVAKNGSISIYAEGRVGVDTNPLETEIAGLAARAPQGIFIAETDALNITTSSGISGINSSTSNGNITITASDLTVSQAINAGGGTITLAPNSLKAIGVGTAVAGAFNIDDPELGRITTSGALVLGGANASSITVDNVTAANTANISTLRLDGQTNSVPVNFSNNPSTFADGLRLEIDLDDDGLSLGQALTLGQGGVGTPQGSGALDIDANGGTITINAQVTAGSGGILIDPPVDLNINAGITTSGSITLEATNNISLGATVESTGAAATVAMTADQDGNGAGAIIDTGGTINVAAGADLRLSAGAGIGSAADPIETIGLNTMAGATRTGGIFLNNTTSGNINVSTVAGLPGLQASTSGDIRVTNTGRNITVSQLVNTNNGQVRLDAAAITISATLQGTSLVDLNGSGAITVAAGGTIRSTTGNVDIDAAGALAVSAGARIIGGGNGTSVTIDAAGITLNAGSSPASATLTNTGTGTITINSTGAENDISLANNAISIGEGALSMTAADDIIVAAEDAGVEIDADGNIQVTASAVGTSAIGLDISGDASGDSTFVLHSTSTTGETVNIDFISDQLDVADITQDDADVDMDIDFSGGDRLLLSGVDPAVTLTTVTTNNRSIALYYELTEAGKNIIIHTGTMTLGGDTWIKSPSNITVGDAAGTAVNLASSSYKLYLDARNAAIQDGGASMNMANGNLMMKAASGIGTSSGFIETANLANLAAETTAGGVFLANSGTTELNITTLTININGRSDTVTGVQTGNSDTITLRSDDMTFSQPVRSAGGIVQLQAVTAGREIDLGTSPGGKLGLTDSDLDNITASTLRIGTTTAGAISITGASTINLTNNTTDLALISDAGISQSGGPLRVASLRIDVDDAVTMTQANDVDNMGANISSAAADFSFTDIDELNIGTVDGLAGITLNGGDIAFNLGGNLTQSAAANITSSTGGLAVTSSSGGVSLNSTNNTNNVARIAADMNGAGGAFLFNDVDALTIGSVAGVNGVSTNSGAIDIRTADGELKVDNTAAGNDVYAGNAAITLIAGSASAAGTARYLRIIPGAKVVAAGANAEVTLRANNIDISENAANPGTVDAGAGRPVNIAQYTNGTYMASGGNATDVDADPDTIALNSTELGNIKGDLKFGDANTGGFVIQGTITPSAGDTVTIDVQTKIIDQNTTGPDIDAVNIILRASGGIGDAGNPIEVDATNLDAENTTSGGIYIQETDDNDNDGLTIKDLSSGSVTLNNIGMKDEGGAGGLIAAPKLVFAESSSIRETSADPDIAYIFQADEIDFTAGADSLQNNHSGSTATLVLQPNTIALEIKIGDIAAGQGSDTSVLDIDNTDLAALRDADNTGAIRGFNLVMGRADGTGTTTLGTVAFEHPTCIRQAGNNGKIFIQPNKAVSTINGQHATDFADLAFQAGKGINGSFTQGDGATIQVGAAPGTPGNLEITADVIVLDEIDQAPGDTNGPDSIRGTGEALLQPASIDTHMTIADNVTGAGFELSTNELNALKDGFSKIIIGRSDGVHAATVNSYNFKDSVHIRAPGAAGNITLTSNSTLSTVNGTETNSIEITAGIGNNGKFTQQAGARITSGNGGDITITADAIELATGTPSSITGTGALLMQPASDARPMVIGAPGTADDFALDKKEIHVPLTDGFSSITIGRSTGQHVTTVYSVSFDDPVTIRAPRGNGNITVTGALRTSTRDDAINLLAGDDIKVDANGKVVAKGTGAVSLIASYDAAGGGDIVIRNDGQVIAENGLITLEGEAISIGGGRGGGRVSASGSTGAVLIKPNRQTSNADFTMLDNRAYVGAGANVTIGVAGQDAGTPYNITIYDGRIFSDRGEVWMRALNNITYHKGLVQARDGDVTILAGGTYNAMSRYADIIAGDTLSITVNQGLVQDISSGAAIIIQANDDLQVDGHLEMGTATNLIIRADADQDGVGDLLVGRGRDTIISTVNGMITLQGEHIFLGHGLKEARISAGGPNGDLKVQADYNNDGVGDLTVTRRRSLLSAQGSIDIDATNVSFGGDQVRAWTGNITIDADANIRLLHGKVRALKGSVSITPDSDNNGTGDFFMANRHVWVEAGSDVTISGNQISISNILAGTGISVQAQDHIVISNRVRTLAGALTLTADADSNGTGDLWLSKGGNAFVENPGGPITMSGHNVLLGSFLHPAYVAAGGTVDIDAVTDFTMTDRRSAISAHGDINIDVNRDVEMVGRLTVWGAGTLHLHADADTNGEGSVTVAHGYFSYLTSKSGDIDIRGENVTIGDGRFGAQLHAGGNVKIEANRNNDASGNFTMGGQQSRIIAGGTIDIDDPVDVSMGGYFRAEGNVTVRARRTLTLARGTKVISKTGSADLRADTDTDHVGNIILGRYVKVSAARGTVHVEGEKVIEGRKTRLSGATIEKVEH